MSVPLSPIRAAARDGRLEEVRRITEEGPSDEVTPPGWTAVQWAAMRGQTEVVLYLLGAGGREAEWDAEETVEDEKMLLEACEGITTVWWAPVHGSPLCLASLRGHEGTVRALLEAGAGGSLDEGAGGWAGSALVHAARNGYVATVKVLVAAGASVDAATSTGITSLMYASSHGHVGVAQVLLAAGVDVGIATSSGLTALFWALIRTRPIVAAALVRHGAAVTPDTIHFCASLAMAEALVIHGGARVTEAVVGAAEVEEVRSFLAEWLAGTHPVQAERREAEGALLAARWGVGAGGGSGGEYFPSELVSIVGEYVHTQERRVRGPPSSSSSS